MRRLVAVGMMVAALLVAVPPATAKGPWRITVRGPGIVGEVDLMEGWPVTWISSSETVVGAPGPARPGPTPPFVVSWYSAVGWDGPVVDRVAVHFDTGAVEVLDTSAVFGPGRTGWFEGRERGLRELRKVIDRVVAARPVGEIGYEYVSATGRSAWAPVDGRHVVRRVLDALAALMPS